jgi:H(+)-translocating pyrophosphatase
VNKSWINSGALIALLALVLVCGVMPQLVCAQADNQAQMTTAPSAASSEVLVESIAIPGIWWVAPIGSIFALFFARFFYTQVKAANPGDANMIEIAGYVRDGAMAYLKRQYKVVAVFFIAVSAILFLMGWVWNVQHKIVFVAFLTGGFFSGLCGYLGMRCATLASNRTAQGAKESLNRGLQVAFRAGAVMGLVVVGFGLLDITAWFYLLTQVLPKHFEMFHGISLVEVTVVMLTFGMGASSQALFARVGGGIFTKAADVGADLVGKVEAGIPEDDPRNPATIADNVGDNVGDVAGMGADLYESYCGSILATASLGVAAAVSMGLGMENAMKLLIAPMVLAGIGIVLSLIGIFMVRTKEGATMSQLMAALNRGINASSYLIVVASFGVCYYLMNGIPGVNWWGIGIAISAGLLSGVVIGKATEVYTSYDYAPTKDVAKSSLTGPATVIISGIAEGMKSTWMSITTIVIAILVAFYASGGNESMLLGLYGVGIAAVGMLATLGITLATDAYGPIADNAGGNAEMTHQDPEVRKRTDALDSLGNTTAAVGKGFAIGSAALTALALLASYIEEVRIGQVREAEPAIVSTYGNEARVGDVVYLGAGKFAVAEADKKGKIIGKSYMALMMPKKIKLTQGKVDLSLGQADDDKVFSGSVTKEGEKGAIELVATETATLSQYMDFYDVTLLNPKVLGGMFFGVLLVFIFSALTMKAVGRAAQSMVQEVRRQFREIKGIMEGKAKPEYAKCVAISTAGAQREMILPSLLALIVPVGIGLLLDVSGVMGLLAGGLSCGFAMAIFMANSGGAWDNAKKYVETGEFGGKGSANHKATVVGDTVGDPFKDTCGPSLNILIKLMSMVSVVFAGLIVKFAPQISAWLHMN